MKCLSVFKGTRRRHGVRQGVGRVRRCVFVEHEEGGVRRGCEGARLDREGSAGAAAGGTSAAEKRCSEGGEDGRWEEEQEEDDDEEEEG